MDARHFGLTPSIAAYLSEAASICLDRHHSSPQDIEIHNDGSSSIAAVDWSTPDARTRAGHANEIDATEAGASACVLAAVELRRGLVAIHRAETLKGADYYVGPIGGDEQDLENAQRLEISGTDLGTDRDLVRLLSAKEGQTQRGESGLPALVGVMSFGGAIIVIQQVDP